MGPDERTLRKAFWACKWRDAMKLDRTDILFYGIASRHQCVVVIWSGACLFYASAWWETSGSNLQCFSQFFFKIFFYYLCGVLLWIFKELKHWRKCMVFKFDLACLSWRLEAELCADFLRKFKPHLKASIVSIPNFQSSHFCFACLLHHQYQATWDVA
jgi:hypothetical protein